MICSFLHLIYDASVFLSGCYILYTKYSIESIIDLSQSYNIIVIFLYEMGSFNPNNAATVSKIFFQGQSYRLKLYSVMANNISEISVIKSKTSGCINFICFYRNV